jgi:predicted nucleic acid-binding protein
MRIALDTNRYSDFVAGEAEAGRVLATADEIHIPIPVLAELRYGFLRGNRLSENEARLRTLLSRPRVFILSPDEQTTHEYAKVMAQLRSQGTPIPINDVWIAALTIQHNLALFDRDHHFDHLPQVARVR